MGIREMKTYSQREPHEYVLGVRKNFAKSKENTCIRVSFLKKLKKDTLAQEFFMNFAKF